MNTNLAGLSQRAHAWDTFEHHIGAWNSQITSLDQKIEHLRRFVRFFDLLYRVSLCNSAFPDLKMRSSLTTQTK